MNFYIRDIRTREIVETIPFNGKTAREAEKLLRALLLRINSEDYLVDDSEADSLYRNCSN